MKKESGQALVEMALVLPILFLLLFAVVEMAIIGFSYITVQNAVSAGANMAVIGGTDAQVTTAIKQASPGLDTNLFTIQINRLTVPDITISLSYPVDLIVPVVPGLANPLPISATLTEVLP